MKHLGQSTRWLGLLAVAWSGCADPCRFADAACISLSLQGASALVDFHAALFTRDSPTTLIRNYRSDASSQSEFRIVLDAADPRPTYLVVSALEPVTKMQYRGCTKLLWEGSHVRTTLEMQAKAPRPLPRRLGMGPSQLPWAAKQLPIEFIRIYDSLGLLIPHPELLKSSIVKLPARPMDPPLPITEIGTGINPTNQVVGDVNQDGLEDILTIDATSGVVTMALRQNDIQFAPHQTVTRWAGLLPAGGVLAKSENADFPNLLLADETDFTKARLLTFMNSKAPPWLGASMANTALLEGEQRIHLLRWLTVGQPAQRRQLVGILTKSRLLVLDPAQPAEPPRPIDLLIGPGEEFVTFIARPPERAARLPNSEDAQLDWDIALALRNTRTDGGRVLLLQLSEDLHANILQAANLERAPIALAFAQLNPDDTPDVISLPGIDSEEVDIILANPWNEQPVVVKQPVEPNYRVQTMVSLGSRSEIAPPTAGVFFMLKDSRGFAAPMVWWPADMTICDE